MARIPRKDIIDLSEPGIFHCRTRCVRRAFLCGKDKRSRKDYEYRRDWIENRVEELAQWFAIKIAFCTIMQNHFHLVLGSLPQVVAKWSDKQVVKRAIKIFPYKFKEMGVVDNDPTPEQVRQFTKDRPLIEEMRSRLADPSWFLRQLKQSVACRANREDEVTGHFFEGRFECSVVLDERGLLVCGLYVDLNQLRALEAATIEDSHRTSAFRRIKGLLARRKGQQAARWDGFLSPINAHGDGQQAGYEPAGTLNSRRISDKGLLEMSLEDYLELLDWTGRQTARGKKGKISADAPPILDRLGLKGETLVTCVEEFDSMFSSAVGGFQSLLAWANKLGRRWLCGAKAVSAAENN